MVVKWLESFSRKTVFALAVTASTAWTPVDWAGSFPAVISLKGLDGSNGFQLNGDGENAQSGSSVASAGDVNGDGFADFIVGSPGRTVGSQTSVGSSYVVFGKASGFPAKFELSSLDGSNGFRLDGVSSGDYSGISVASAGDVNGDGFADLIVGAPRADPDGVTDGGSSYVVFGKSSGFASVLDLSSLDGSNGFRLDGVSGREHSGWSVASAGDVNGDGFADLIIGAPSADPGGRDFAGSSYVVFGKASGFKRKIKLSSLDGSNGFRLDGITAQDSIGSSVASAGDVNGDGFADLIVGSANKGSSYVVFGRATGFGKKLLLSSLDGGNGFQLKGFNVDDAGRSVASAGDVNGDGFADLIVGAPGADPGGRDAAGSSYVVFGKASGFKPTISLSLLDGSNGFRLDGVSNFDFTGWSVASAGDVNGDGFDDLIIGAPYPSPTHPHGSSYVVFGRASGFGPFIELSSLDGSNGFRIKGEKIHTGWSVASAWDVNGDGFADLIIGAPDATEANPGRSYMVFGHGP